LVIPDLHFPFPHPKWYKFLKEIKETNQIDLVVNLGDEIDLHSISRHVTDPDGFSPGHEIEASKKYVKQLASLFPHQLVCWGNHTERIRNRVKEVGLPGSVMKDYKEIFGIPDTWIYDYSHEVDGIVYTHGHAGAGKPLAMNLAMKMFKSVVCGHSHTQANLQYYSTKDSLIFGMTCGCLVDPHSYAFDYAKTQVSRPILGVGFVRNGLPSFIPMTL